MQIQTFRNQIPFQKLAIITDRRRDMNLPGTFTCTTRDGQENIVSSTISKPYTIPQLQTKKRKLEEDYRVVIEDEDKNFRGAEYIILDPKAKKLYIRSMRSSKSGDGVGTIFHLYNIIDLLENADIPKIDLISTSLAFPFHLGFGFEPKCSWAKNLAENLEKISKDKNPALQEQAKKAKELLESNFSMAKRNKLGNNLLKEFGEVARNVLTREEFDFYFDRLIPMVLTRKDVMRNKNHYNNLLKEYNIDYEI